MTSPEDQIKSDFDWFRSECIKLRNSFNTSQALFDSGSDTRELLIGTAVLFFDDLNEWLNQLIILQVGRVTDPAGSRGKRKLTAKHFTRELKELGILSEKITQLEQSLEAYRDKISDARNKVVAHSELKTFREGILHGVHTKEEAYSFFNNLNEFTDEVGRALGVGPLDYSVQAEVGDVHHLLNVLEKLERIGLAEDD